jgi:hypothetical protein
VSRDRDRDREGGTRFLVEGSARSTARGRICVLCSGTTTFLGANDDDDVEAIAVMCKKCSLLGLAGFLGVGSDESGRNLASLGSFCVDRCWVLWGVGSGSVQFAEWCIEVTRIWHCLSHLLGGSFGLCVHFGIS